MARKLSPESPILTLDCSDYTDDDYTSWLCVRRLSKLFDGYQKSERPKHIQVVAYERRGADRVKIAIGSDDYVTIDAQHTFLFYIFEDWAEKQIAAGRSYFGLWEINP